MKGKIKFTITMLVLMLFSLAQLMAQSWHVYDGSQLPEDAGYTYADSKGSAIVHSIIDDPDIPGNKLYEYYVDSADSKHQWEADFGGPVDYITVVTRMKSSLPDSFIGVSNIRLYNGVDRVVFKLEDTRINPENTVLNANYDMDGTQWHIFRFVMDSSLVKVYLDERPRPVMVDTSNDLNSDTYFRWGDGSDGDEYGGQVDWIVWDTSGAYPPGAGPVIPQSLLYPDAPALAAKWSFNGSLVDSVGSADGTMYGGTGDVYVASLLDSALDLSNPDSVIMIASADSTKDLVFGINSFSVSCLTKHDPAGSVLDAEQYLVVKGDMGGELTGADRKGNWYGLATKENEIRFIIDDDVKKVQLGAPDNLWIPNAYNLIVGVRDTEQDSLFLYLNGVKIGSNLDEAANVLPDSMPVQIGGLVWRNDRGVDGYIEEVNIWNHALTPAEIAAMWASYPSQIQPVVVDGVISQGEWNRADAMVVEKQLNPVADTNIADENDYSLYFKMLWSDTALYLLIDVTDDTIFLGSANVYEDDNIEIYFDMNNSKIQKWPRDKGWSGRPWTQMDDNDMQLRIQPTEAAVLYESNLFGTTVPNTVVNGIVLAQTSSATGYIFEMMFDFDSLAVGYPEFVAQEGTEIGFDIDASDNDGDPDARDELGWNADHWLIYTDACLWGTLQFNADGTVTQILDNEAPTAPTNLAASVEGINVTLTWDASTDNIIVNQYNIYVAGIPVGSVMAKETDNGGPIAVTGVPAGTYPVGISAVDPSGNESAPSLINVTITGIDEKTVTYSIYPVPASEILVVENAEYIEHIEVFNMVGESILNVIVEAYYTELDISGLNPGVYVLKIHTTGEVFSEQLIIE
jgi:hypothetical protein